MSVKPKKHLGQHFLIDRTICQKIADSFLGFRNVQHVLEVGPGKGAITGDLLQREGIELHIIDLDKESIAYLKEHFPDLSGRIHEADFLKIDFSTIFGKHPFAVVGNFPYNISSQILFKCLENRNQIPEIMGMFQRELAERVMEKPGSKQYGILSVMLQTYYDIEYCFTVSEHVFDPPPKVKSGVIRCTRNSREKLDVDEKLHEKVIKATFNQRRKTVRNGLKNIIDVSNLAEHPFLTLRPERLSVEDFIELTRFVQQYV
jgi:16S rRNA (adenine1518-N6/adenine1519-N6)-dimethyltransferase